MSVIFIDSYIEKKAKEIVKLYLEGKEHEAMMIAASIPEGYHAELKATITDTFERYTGL